MGKEESEGQDEKGGKATKDDVKTNIPPPADFGVKSYLHHFYERVAVSNPNEFEELQGFGKKTGRCASIWWRVGVWVGMNLLVFGIVAILVGYLVPQRTVVEAVYENVEVIDHSAQQFNNNLDICKMVGLIVFCCGGLAVALTLLLPSFTSHCHDDDATIVGVPTVADTAEFTAQLSAMTTAEAAEEEEPKSPTDKQVPATEKVKGVQPKRKGKEALMTSNEGTFTMTR